LGLKFLTNVKNIYEKRFFYHFVLLKKSLDLKELKIMLQLVPIGFGLASISLMFR
jgi:hypothetical protein